MGVLEVIGWIIIGWLGLATLLLAWFFWSMWRFEKFENGQKNIAPGPEKGAKKAPHLYVVKENRDAQAAEKAENAPAHIQAVARAGEGRDCGA